MLDSLPPSVTTPELRLPLRRRAQVRASSRRPPAHFRDRYPVNEIDGVRITFPHGWGLLRPSNTGPRAGHALRGGLGRARLTAYRDEVEALPARPRRRRERPRRALTVPRQNDAVST
jgi:hypothetical protein